jgi:hypothetical protein
VNGRERERIERKTRVVERTRTLNEEKRSRNVPKSWRIEEKRSLNGEKSSRHYEKMDCAGKSRDQAFYDRGADDRVGGPIDILVSRGPVGD